MNLIKRIGWYLLELLAVFALLYGLFRGNQAIEQAMRSGSFDFNSYGYVRLAYVIVYPIIFGVLIRVPSLIRRWPSGKQFHWLRFCVLVAPVLLLFAQVYSAFLFGISVWLPLFATSSVALPLLGIWAGVNLTDCIKGKERRSAGKPFS